MIFMFLIYFGMVATLTRLFVLFKILCTRHKLLFESIIQQADQFNLFTLPFWFFLENIFKVLMTLIIEFLYIIGTPRAWELEYATKYKVVLCVSGLIFILYFALLLSVIIKGIKNALSKKYGLMVVASGINLRRKIYVILYYFHFFLIWLSIVILVALTPFVSSPILFILLTFVQVICLLLNIPRLYESVFFHIQSLLREFYILVVTMMLTTL